MRELRPCGTASAFWRHHRRGRGAGPKRAATLTTLTCRPAGGGTGKGARKGTPLRPEDVPAELRKTFSESDEAGESLDKLTVAELTELVMRAIRGDES